MKIKIRHIVGLLLAAVVLTTSVLPSTGAKYISSSGSLGPLTVVWIGPPTMITTFASNQFFTVEPENAGWYAMVLWGASGGKAYGQTATGTPGANGVWTNKLPDDGSGSIRSAGQGGCVMAVVKLAAATYTVQVGSRGVNDPAVNAESGGRSGSTLATGGKGNGTNIYAQPGGGGGYSGFFNGTPGQGTAIAMAGGGGGAASAGLQGAAFKASWPRGGDGGSWPVPGAQAPGYGGDDATGDPTYERGAGGGRTNQNGPNGGGSSTWTAAGGASGSGTALYGGDAVNSNDKNNSPGGGGGGAGYNGGGAGGCYGTVGNQASHNAGGGGGGSSYLTGTNAYSFQGNFSTPVGSGSALKPEVASFLNGISNFLARPPVSTNVFHDGAVRLVYLGPNDPTTTEFITNWP